MKVLRHFFTFFLLLFSFILYGQNTSMLKMLNDSLNVGSGDRPVIGTFDGVYLINSATVETTPHKTLLLLVMHRFGAVNLGAYNFFGLDFATMRLGFEYGISDRLSVGIGRSTLNKTFDTNLKWKILQQKRGIGAFPITVDLMGSLYYTTLRFTDSTHLDPAQRTSSVVSLLMAKKVSENFSVQLSPSWIHYNLVPTPLDKTNVLNLGVGARMKVTKRMDIQGEYNYVPPGQINSYKRYNSLSLGVDFVTGGHVFQLQLTNSEAMTAPDFMGKTTDSWTRGGIFFGFNLSRAFQMGDR